MRQTPLPHFPVTALALGLALALAARPEPAAAGALDARFEAASTAALSNPHDIKLSPDGRALHVSDVGNDRVVVLDPETLALVWSYGADHQRGTHDVDFDAGGRALVADTHNARIGIYRIAGRSAELIDTIEGPFRGPEGVLAHPNGRIYVAGAWSDSLTAFEDGTAVAHLDGLTRPHDVEVAPDGTIWLADSGNDRMLRLSPDLEILEELSGPTYGFRGVRYQDVLADGTLIVADKNTHRVLIIAPDRSVQAVLGIGLPGLGEGVFRTPEGIETRGDTLWIADSGNDRVVRYRLIRD